MHAGELRVDEHLAQTLLAREFPDLSDLPVRRLDAAGTVNTIVRFGGTMHAGGSSMVGAVVETSRITTSGWRSASPAAGR